MSRWFEVAETCMTAEQAPGYIGIPHGPDFVRTWFGWKIACKQHDLTFGDVWEYAEHWHEVHEESTP